MRAGSDSFQQIKANKHFSQNTKHFLCRLKFAKFLHSPQGMLMVASACFWIQFITMQPKLGFICSVFFLMKCRYSYMQHSVLTNQPSLGRELLLSLFGDESSSCQVMFHHLDFVWLLRCSFTYPKTMNCVCASLGVRQTFQDCPRLIGMKICPGNLITLPYFSSYFPYCL